MLPSINLFSTKAVCRQRIKRNPSEKESGLWCEWKNGTTGAEFYDITLPDQQKRKQHEIDGQGRIETPGVRWLAREPKPGRKPGMRSKTPAAASSEVWRWRAQGNVMPIGMMATIETLSFLSTRQF